MQCLFWIRTMIAHMEKEHHPSLLCHFLTLNNPEGHYLGKLVCSLGYMWVTHHQAGTDVGWKNGMGEGKAEAPSALVLGAAYARTKGTLQPTRHCVIWQRIGRKTKSSLCWCLNQGSCIPFPRCHLCKRTPHLLQFWDLTSYSFSRAISWPLRFAPKDKCHLLQLFWSLKNYNREQEMFRAKIVYGCDMHRVTSDLGELTFPSRTARPSIVVGGLLLVALFSCCHSKNSDIADIAEVATWV